MAAPGSINEYGVITPTETLALPLERKGWRGVPLAEIAIAKLSDGWRAYGSFHFSTGDCHGGGGPVSIQQTPVATRETAIEAAAARIRTVAERRGGREAAKIVSWLDSLRPAQADLFEMAA